MNCSELENERETETGEAGIGKENYKTDLWKDISVDICSGSSFSVNVITVKVDAYQSVALDTVEWTRIPYTGFGDGR